MRARLAILVLTLVASSLLGPLFIANVQAAGCVNPCSFETDTNVPASAGSITVRLNGTTYYTLNHTFSFSNNTQQRIEVMNTTLYVAATGARYVFKQWTYKGGQWSSTPLLLTPFILANYTSTTNGSFVAQFEKQFQLTLSFSDPSGNPLGPPSSVTLQGPSTLTITSYSGQWLAAQVWTVADATWESMPGSVFGSPTVNLSNGPVAATIPLKAYSATIQVVDNLNNPVAGVTITATFVNSTTKSFTTDSQGKAQLGYVPIGPYTAHLVYNSQDMGQYSIDASATPTNTVRLGIGGQTSAPVVSAVVLLTIFGVALLLVLLAIKVRKPPLPPTIN